MKSNRKNERKIRNIIREQLQEYFVGFSCLIKSSESKRYAVNRHAEHSFSENEFKVPLKRGDEWVFHKDYKWSNILTKTGELLDSGTWKCDGENEFEIDLPTHTYSSKMGWKKK
jgi:hypothetical protein